MLVSTDQLRVGDVILGSEREDTMIPFALTVVEIKTDDKTGMIGLRFEQGSGQMEWFNPYWDWYIKERRMCRCGESFGGTVTADGTHHVSTGACITKG